MTNVNMIRTILKADLESRYSKTILGNLTIPFYTLVNIALLIFIKVILQGQKDPERILTYLVTYISFMTFVNAISEGISFYNLRRAYLQNTVINPLKLFLITLMPWFFKSLIYLLFLLIITYQKSSDPLLLMRVFFSYIILLFMGAIFSYVIACFTFFHEDIKLLWQSYSRVLIILTPLTVNIKELGTLKYLALTILNPITPYITSMSGHTNFSTAILAMVIQFSVLIPLSIIIWYNSKKLRLLYT